MQDFSDRQDRCFCWGQFDLDSACGSDVLLGRLDVKSQRCQDSRFIQVRAKLCAWESIWKNFGLFDFATSKTDIAFGESVGHTIAWSITATEEPVIYCLQSDHGSFTQNCDQAGWQSVVERHITWDGLMRRRVCKSLTRSCPCWLGPQSKVPVPPERVGACCGIVQWESLVWKQCECKKMQNPPTPALAVKACLLGGKTAH